jgi:carotenoid cleavage dioxygenase-like enzyme
MSRPFPENEPMLQGAFAPVFVEGDSCDLPVTGEIPKALNGTLYRNGPNPQFAPRGHYHWFGGDGMVHAFTLENGRATYRNRWVRTPRFELERKAGEALFGGFGDPSKSDPRAAAADFGVANTHIIYHAGKLLALEESHLPFELTRSLDSIGYHTFGGVLPTTIEGRFTAHPKIDPENGELVGFSYSGSSIWGKRMSLVIIAATGQLVRQDFFEAPYSSFVHDFLMTRDHVVFPILPLAGDKGRATRGGPAYAWDPSQPALLGVVGRRAPIGSLKWHPIPPCYVFHTFNAWEDGGSIHGDVIKYERAPLFPDIEGNPAPPESTLGFPVRWSIDLSGQTDKVKETELADVSGEFPRLDERRAGAEYNRAFYNAFSPDSSSTQALFNAVAQLTLTSGRIASFSVPDGDALSEPVFAARSAASPEGDGFLLTVQYIRNENRSDLLILDTADLEQGPTARVHLSHRVPAGFHGSWVPASES